MNNLHECKLRWGEAIANPWKATKLVGSTKVAHEDLSKLLKQSVNLQSDGRGGECISALLIGPSGVGKTFVVRSCIESLRSTGNLVIPLTLHGGICSDDKSSMRQIFSQFQRYLIGGSSLDSLSRVSFKQGTLTEWCERLSRLLQECTRSDHIVVITLEDFDIFCHSKSKQSLLYNLFDLMHVQDTRFVVIGVTKRPDASELLEKRIKSRFQLRKIVLSPPDSVEELINIVKAALSPNYGKAVVSKFRGREVPIKLGTSVEDFVNRALESKEVHLNWSFYRDLGYSVRDITNAAISALLVIQNEDDIHAALSNCLQVVSDTSVGDIGAIKSLIPSLSLREHIVLIGLLKLHQYRKRPKCFAHILKEIGSFEKRSTCSQICRHSKRAYWHAFNGLVRHGVIELIENVGASQSVCAPPVFARCRLAIFDSYRSLCFDTKSRNGILSVLPTEVLQWAAESKDVNEGI